jgi:hypothetical protein
MKAASTPWTMRIITERAAQVLGAKGEIVGTFRILDARLVVEAVNERARVEREAYALEWTAEDVRVLVEGALREGTL